ncbi:MAG: nitroreductase [Pseudomonadota bacterium]
MTSSWIDDLPPAPQFGDPMPAPTVRPETLAYLSERRSMTAAQMSGPGPTADETAALLSMAARVPDHRRVHPFRFLTFTGDSRQAFGDILSAAYRERNPDATEDTLALEAGRFLRAPLVVAVISAVQPEHKTPEWEQVLTVGAVCQNLVIAAGAAGYAAQWLTEWYTYDDHVTAAMGLTEHERVAGFVYIGTPAGESKERARIPAAELTQAWTA